MCFQVPHLPVTQEEKNINIRLFPPSRSPLAEAPRLQGLSRDEPNGTPANRIRRVLLSRTKRFPHEPLSPSHTHQPSFDRLSVPRLPSRFVTIITRPHVPNLRDRKKLDVNEDDLRCSRPPSPPKALVGITRWSPPRAPNRRSKSPGRRTWNSFLAVYFRSTTIPSLWANRFPASKNSSRT